MIEKEVRFFFADPQAIFFSLALPLLILAVFIGTFGNINSVDVTGNVVDLDQTAASKAFLDRLAGTPGVTLRLFSAAEASRRLERSDITSYVVLESGFGGRIAAGEVSLKVYRRGNGGVEGQIFSSYAVAVGMEMAGEIRQEQAVVADLAALGLEIEPADARAALATYRQEQAASPRVALREEALGQRPEMVTFYLPGLVSMFAIFSVALAAESVVSERKSGTLERLMTTRLSRREMILGKWIAFASRTWIQVLILFTVGWIWFRVFTPATFAQVMTFTIVVVAAGASLGMFIAAFARTTEQAIWSSVIISNVMAMLGGSFTPIPQESVIGKIARFTPNHWANQGYKDLIAKDLTLASPQVWQGGLILAAIAALLLGLAMMAFRVRRDEK